MEEKTCLTDCHFNAVLLIRIRIDPDFLPWSGIIVPDLAKSKRADKEKLLILDLWIDCVVYTKGLVLKIENGR